LPTLFALLAEPLAGQAGKVNWDATQKQARWFQMFIKLKGRHKYSRTAQPGELTPDWTAGPKTIAIAMA
jgi:hypothetical protein